MRHRSKLLLAALAAALAIGSLAQTASGSRLSLSERAATWSWLPFTIGSSALAINLGCNITLSGSFHSSTFAKTTGALIGHITRAAIEPCIFGAATILLNSLSWNRRFGRWTSSLPRISTVTTSVVGLSIRIDPDGIVPACLFRTTTENPAVFIDNIDAEGNVTGTTADPTAQIPLSEGFGSGMFEAYLEGTATPVTPGGGRLRWRLI